jgi:hypothetical protein
MLLSAASAVLAFCLGSPAARAAEGPHKGNEGHGLHVPPSEIPHEGGVSIFGGKEHRPDEWRYRNEHGAWWYWTPKNHWMFYENGSWQEYSGDAVDVAPTAPDPNYYWFHDQWWYWQHEHWVFWDHEHWHEGELGKSPPPRGVIHHEEPRKEEPRKEEPRKVEHEAPKK